MFHLEKERESHGQESKDAQYKVHAVRHAGGGLELEQQVGEEDEEDLGLAEERRCRVKVVVGKAGSR